MAHCPVEMDLARNMAAGSEKALEAVEVVANDQLRLLERMRKWTRIYLSRDLGVGVPEEGQLSVDEEGDFVIVEI